MLRACTTVTAMEKLCSRWAADAVINWGTHLKKLRMHSLLIPGDQTKILRAVMAAYLLCRCKYL